MIDDLNTLSDEELDTKLNTMASYIEAIEKNKKYREVQGVRSEVLNSLTILSSLSLRVDVDDLASFSTIQNAFLDYVSANLKFRNIGGQSDKRHVDTVTGL